MASLTLALRVLALTTAHPIIEQRGHCAAGVQSDRIEPSVGRGPEPLPSASP